VAARTARLILAGALAATCTACVQDDGTRFNPVQDALTVSEEEERELGFEFDRALRENAVVIEDPVIAGFINDLGQEVVRGIEPQPFIYRFRVIQHPALNAFAVPGGYVYFHSGTVLAAGNIDELAGVMGHEVAHVKAHHYKRAREKSQIPELLTNLAGIAASIATKDATPMVAAQSANVAVQLRFSREFENEADQLGGVFMTRAGYRPDGITRFFERILELSERYPQQVPPYLYSHPDVEDRIRSVEQQAQKLRTTGAPDPRFARELREVQARLAYLLDTGRDNVPPPSPPEDPKRIEPHLRRADRLAQEGRLDEALVVLAGAERLEPNDPRAPYQIAELLAARGRHLEAIAAYRRTVRLDPTRARVFYRMGVAHRAVGARHSAVHAFEQAVQRSGARSDLRKRSEWQIETLIFPPFTETRLTEVAATGPREDPGTGPREDPGTGEESFAATATGIVWWGKLADRYDGYADRLQVRWRGPRGVLVTTPTEETEEGWARSQLELPAAGKPGSWKLEVLYEGDVLKRSAFRLQPSR